MCARHRSYPDIRIGIIGCGRAASLLHVPVLRRLGGASVVALADRDPERLRSLGSQVDGVALYPEYNELLADERVDLVAVCVPVGFHAAVASHALAAGKHVFIEKPLALTLNECQELDAQARRAELQGIRSAVGFNLRSHRLVRRAKETVQAGRLGTIELVRAMWTADWIGHPRPSWHGRRDEGGGALFDIGSHLIDLWRFLLESEVETVSAVSNSATFDDQTAVFQARLANGVLAAGAVSHHSVAHNTLEVLGTRGSVRLSCYHADSFELCATRAPQSGPWRRLKPLLTKTAELPGALVAAKRGGDFKASYLHQWQSILEAIHRGGPMPASVHDGLQAFRVVLAALRSAQAGAILFRTPETGPPLASAPQ